jgi:hypothetical protein
MPPSPHPRTPDTAGTLAAQASGEDAELSGEIAVPRGIKRWSKWRQATLRAEHREARQRLRTHLAETSDDATAGRTAGCGSVPDAAPGGGILPS